LEGAVPTKNDAAAGIPVEVRSSIKHRPRAIGNACRATLFRHSFASVAVGSGLGLPTVRKLFGHSQPATTARYPNLDADPVRRTVNSIGVTIAAGLGNKDWRCGRDAEGLKSTSKVAHWTRVARQASPSVAPRPGPPEQHLSVSFGSSAELSNGPSAVVWIKFYMIGS
jgi:hypothetical protein